MFVFMVQKMPNAKFTAVTDREILCHQWNSSSELENLHGHTEFRKSFT